MSDKYNISIITTQHASSSAKSQLGNLNYGMNEINGQQTRRIRQFLRKRETARKSQQWKIFQNCSFS